MGNKPTSRPVAADQQHLRILVVDDSAISRKVIEYALTDLGDEIVFANDGKEALRIFGQRPADLVITDWVMEDYTGPDLCRKIRVDFREFYTYLVLLTSNSDSQSVAQGLAAGADDYLKKPFEREELQARVGVGRRVIRMHRTIEANNRRLFHEARTEPLTGLPNRRAVDEWATKQIAGAWRHGYPLWVLAVSVDSYKEICDGIGRTEGDAALKAFAEVLKKNTRISDMCGHLGGDEFVMVVTHVDQAGIETLIERLKTAAAELPSFAAKTRGVPVSFGRTTIESEKETSLAALMRQADAALRETRRPMLANRR